MTFSKPNNLFKFSKLRRSLASRLGAGVLMRFSEFGSPPVGNDLSIDTGKNPGPPEKRRNDTLEVAILGCDPDFENLLYNMVALGVRPVAVHSPTKNYYLADEGDEVRLDKHRLAKLMAETGFDLSVVPESIPLLDETSFKAMVIEKQVPVIIGAYGLRERDYFRETLLYARNRLKLTAPLIHPGALCDRFCFPPQRFLITGYPGSGNMVVQNCVGLLLAAAAGKTWSPSPLCNALSQYAMYYWHSLSDLIIKAFDGHGRWADIAGSTHIRWGAQHISLSSEDTYTSITGLPMRSFAWANPWVSSHEPLTKACTSFFREQGFKIIGICRHPLDVIVSNAAKLTAEGGDRAPQILLQNDEWFEEMVKMLEAYYARIVRNQDDVILVRYEDLLADPLETLQKLAEGMGLSVSKKDCKTIWDEGIQGKTLSTDRGHYWAPKQDKWQSYIPPRYAERICNSPLREYAEKLGYKIDSDDFRGELSDTPENHCDLMNVAWQEARWEIPTGKPPNIFHQDIVIKEFKELGIQTVTRKFYQPVFDELLESKMFREVMQAARLEPWNESNMVLGSLLEDIEPE